MNLSAKLASLAAMGVSSFVAPKIAAGTWKFFTGEEPPSEEEGSQLSQILVFAAISAVLVAAIQHLTTSLADKATADKKGEELSS